MPAGRYIFLIVTVLLAGGITLYFASTVAKIMELDAPRAALAIPALLVAALAWRLVSRSRD